MAIIINNGWEKKIHKDKLKIKLRNTVQQTRGEDKPCMTGFSTP